MRQVKDNEILRGKPDVENPHVRAEGRLESLDVLRGFDMLFIMGLASLVIGVCGLFGCGDGFWLVDQMKHPDWIGITLYDTIFPLFIFIAGLSFPFSMAKQLASGRTKAAVALRVLKRAAVLFLLGMVYERYFMGVPLRFGSVLGRIGISWALAALLTVVFGVRVRALVLAAVVLGYWWLNLAFVAPDHPACGVFTPQGNIVCWFDRAFVAPLGRIAPGTERLPFDRQTALSTLMAMVTAMLGVFTGEFVRSWRGRISGNRMAGVLFGGAVVLGLVGWLIACGCGRWSFPFSKALWSPSFTFAVAAYSLGLFAVFYWLIDVRGWWRSTLFFRVIGLNAIAIYLAQPVFGFHNVNKMLFGRFASLFPASATAVVLQTTYVLVCWLFLYFLYRKKVFFKV